MLRRILPFVAVIGGGIALYRGVVAPWWRTWGVDPDEALRAFPGDDIVAGEVTTETRAITIGAPPASVWPWLVQMGFGRAGWYSYDAIDMKGESAIRILPEHQELVVGDIVPTHPGGGFVVRSIEANRHLVMYVDSDMVRQQAEEARHLAAEAPSNLRVAGAFMETGQPTEFRATWAFVLNDLGDGRTRLIERFRIRFGDAAGKPWTRITMPIMGFGVFVMIRRQLLGIRQRAEQHLEPKPEPVAA
jgi:hypothetical protein